VTKEKNWMDWAPEKNGILPGIAEQSRAGFDPQGRDCTAAPRCPKPFDALGAVMDSESAGQPTPKGAKLVSAPGMFGGSFVPVSFVAKDWSVTPRRIRALLAAGRLQGRLQENGYWEVLYPYSFTFGTRGPSLKRQQRPPKRPRLVVDNTEQRAE
jgi:hypothetical protein